MEVTIIHELAIAFGLGLIVGFQREWAEKPIAGVRTFPLITILGVLCARAGGEYGGWVPAVGLAGVTAFIIMGNLMQWKDGQNSDAGITTEIAALVMYLVGMMVVLGEFAVAVIVGGAAAVLLQWKRPIHNLVHKTEEADLQAVFQLVLIGLVILPALPDVGYGPYGVINPFKVWLIVVLIVGISLVAYVAYKVVGTRGGTVVAGILGGFISSTATTMSAARGARDDPKNAARSATIILLASTVVFARVLFEIAIVAFDLLPEMALPLVVMMGIMALVAVMSLGWGGGQQIKEAAPPKSPGLKTAIVFGLLYMMVLLVVATAKDFFGDEGLYIAAGISGLTDMDAITLSTAQLVNAGELDPGLAWRLILVGSMANMVFKGGMAGLLGGRHLFMRVAAGFAVAILGGVGLIVFLP